MRSNSRAILVFCLCAVLALSGCGKSEQEIQAQERALDNDSSKLTSCAHEAVMAVGLRYINRTDAAAICEKMARRMGHNPSVKLFRNLSKTVYFLNEKGLKDGMEANAYQMMRIAESRGQTQDDDAMIATFNIVFKIFVGMEGRVTPKDINVLLSQAGPGAKKMSDDGLYYIAAALSVAKQDMGQ